MNLSEAENDRGYIIVSGHADLEPHNMDSDVVLQPGNRIRVTINDKWVIVFRILGSDTRYSIPKYMADDIVIRKAH
jgi:hypothetical protein